MCLLRLFPTHFNSGTVSWTSEEHHYGSFAFLLRDTGMGSSRCTKQHLCLTTSPTPSPHPGIPHPQTRDTRVLHPGLGLLSLHFWGGDNHFLRVFLLWEGHWYPRSKRHLILGPRWKVTPGVESLLDQFCLGTMTSWSNTSDLVQSPAQMWCKTEEKAAGGVTVSGLTEASQILDFTFC